MGGEADDLDRTLVPLPDEELRARRAMPILEQVAEQLWRRLGGRVPREDLQSIGNVALLGLLRTHDEARLPLESYLRRRLHWAILDGVRRETHGRAAASRARALEGMDLLAQEGARKTIAGGPEGMPPSERTFGLELRSLLARHMTVCGVALLAGAEVGSGPRPAHEAAGDSNEQPERIVQRRALVRALRDAVAALPDERQRRLVEEHYFNDERFDHIAERLGLSPSRASRLHATAIEELGRRLRALLKD